MKLWVVAAIVAVVGCRHREVPADAGPVDLEVGIFPDRPDELLYVDLTGAVRTARGVAAVPVLSRHAVAIEGPDGPGGAVWIADVSRPMPAWVARRATRRDLERRGLASLPPGAGSRITFPSAEDGDVVPAGDGVVVYGTIWCGACRDARDWLDARRVPHGFRDVERDPAAARDAAALCAALGVTADRVPVIDVAGRVVLGFDPVRLTSILGEPI
jgi:mycoredoxin